MVKIRGTYVRVSLWLIGIFVEIFIRLNLIQFLFDWILFIEFLILFVWKILCRLNIICF